MPRKYIKKNSLDINERFLARFDKKSDLCWEWKGAMNENGYGRLIFNKKIHPAHRFSFEHFIGKIPNGLFVLHHCDNRKCVNPSHLFLGTRGDNFRDCVTKGRHPIAKRGSHPEHMQGENHHNCKLTESLIIEIKKKLNEGYRNKDIVNKYNIGSSHVSRIKNNQTWRNTLCL